MLTNIVSDCLNPAKISQDEIDRYQAAIAAEIMGWTDARLLGGMGFLNNLIYCAGLQEGIFQKGKKAIEPALNFLQRFTRKIDVTVPLSFAAECLKKFWAGAVTSRNSARIIRDTIEGWGVFTVDRTQATARKRGQKATYLDFNPIQALLTYQAFEAAWKDRGKTLEDLPGHRGATCKRLYDALFSLTLGFGRRPDPSAGSQPMTEEEAATLRAEQVLKTESDRHKRLKVLRESQAEFDRIGFTESQPDLMSRIADEIIKLKRYLFGDHNRHPEWDEVIPY